MNHRASSVFLLFWFWCSFCCDIAWLSCRVETAFINVQAHAHAHAQTNTNTNTNTNVGLSLEVYKSLLASTRSVQAQDVGTSARAWVRNVRLDKDDPPTFYRDLLDALVIVFHQEKMEQSQSLAKTQIFTENDASTLRSKKRVEKLTENVRFVPKNHPLAYKNEVGECIRMPPENPHVVAAMFALGFCCKVQPLNGDESAIDLFTAASKDLTNLSTKKVNLQSTGLQRQPMSMSMPMPTPTPTLNQSFEHSLSTDSHATTAETQLSFSIDNRKLTYATARHRIQEWIEGLIPFFIPGIVCGMLSFLSMLLVMLCRFCCSNNASDAGLQKGPEVNDSLVQKRSLLALWVLFLMGILVVVILMSDFNSNATQEMKQTFELSLVALNNVHAWTYNISSPLVSFALHIADGNLFEIESMLNDTAFVDTGIQPLLDRLDQFTVHAGNVRLPRGCHLRRDSMATSTSSMSTWTSGPTNPFCFTCDKCAVLPNEIKAVQAQIQASASNGMEAFRNFKEALMEDFIKIASSMESTILARINHTMAFQQSTEEAMDFLRDIQVTWEAQDRYRDVGLSFLILVGILVLTLNVAAFVFAQLAISRCSSLQCTVQCLFNAAYLASSVGLIFSFLVGALMLTFSVALGDVCEMTLFMSENWQVVVKEEAASGWNACFLHNQQQQQQQEQQQQEQQQEQEKHATMLESYNLTRSFRLADSLRFPNSTASDLFDFSDLDRLKQSIDVQTYETFNLDRFSITSLIIALNDNTKVNEGGCRPNDRNLYSMDNILAPWEAFNEPVDSQGGFHYIAQRYSLNGPRRELLLSCDTLPSLKCHLGLRSTCNYEAYVLELWFNASTLYTLYFDMQDFILDLKTNMS